MLDRLRGNLHGVTAVPAVHGHADLLAERLELVGGGGTVGVAGGEKRLAPLALEQVGELGRRGGLAGALEADEHDHVGRAVLREDELGVGGAEKVGELVEDDLHDVLGGRQRVHDLGGQALLLAARHELLDHAVVDVGLEERHANLAHRAVDVVLGETTLAAELGEGVLESVGEAVEHCLHPFANERAAEVERVKGLQVVDRLAHADAEDRQAELV